MRQQERKTKRISKINEINSYEGKMRSLEMKKKKKTYEERHEEKKAIYNKHALDIIIKEILNRL